MPNCFNNINIGRFSNHFEALLNIIAFNKFHNQTYFTLLSFFIIFSLEIMVSNNIIMLQFFHHKKSSIEFSHGFIHIIGIFNYYMLISKNCFMIMPVTNLMGQGFMYQARSFVTIPTEFQIDNFQFFDVMVSIFIFMCYECLNILFVIYNLIFSFKFRFIIEINLDAFLFI